MSASTSVYPNTWSVIEGVPFGETTVYPGCQRGIFDRNYAHDFCDYTPASGGVPLMYCRQCGLVQKLEVLP